LQKTSGSVSLGKRPNGKQPVGEMGNILLRKRLSRKHRFFRWIGINMVLWLAVPAWRINWKPWKHGRDFQMLVLPQM